MILQKDFILITLGNLHIASHLDPLAKSQFTFDPEATKGWTDGVDINIETINRPNQWGAFSEKPLPAGRVITLSGFALGETPEHLHNMRDQLVTVFGVDKYGTISVSNSKDTRTATVAVEGSVNWTQLLDKVASWKIDLFAPDPRVYGVEQRVQIQDATTSGGLNYKIDYPIDFNLPTQAVLQYISNNGSVPSWPTFIVTGDFASGFTLTDNLGHNVVYSGMVTMHSPVMIDMGAGTALQNGRDVSTMVSKRQWFSIPPNESIRPSFYPKQDGSGWCDIIYRDTWI